MTAAQIMRARLRLYLDAGMAPAEAFRRAALELDSQSKP
jgi:hypothetical protein